MKEELAENLFRLIESLDSNNMKLALLLLKNNPELKAYADRRYGEILQLCGKKSFRSLPKIFEDVRSRKIRIGTIKNHQKPLLRMWMTEIFADEESPYNQQRRLNTTHEILIPNSQISILPSTIGKLPILRYLDLPNNQIKELPDTIGNLTRLTHLGLYNNQISSLPASLGKLKTLQRMDLRKNPIAIQEIQQIKTILPECEVLH
ncbi:MAG: leucine-rich repeat domain-containing protein [Saprospiraceae bacterium]|nr:leucine-rich repeat domain-containing protein [Saprospiraceae bacterium]